jgi:hypothetical protein
VEAVLRRALSKRQQDRFPTIAAFSRSFEAAAPPPGATPAPVPRAPAPPKESSLFVGQALPSPAPAAPPRRRGAWLIAVVLAAAVGVGVAWATRAGKLPFDAAGAAPTAAPSGPTVVPLPNGKPSAAKAAEAKRRRASAER